MTAQRSPWRFFDRIYCISLTDRSDRRASAAEEFSRVGLLPQVEFVTVRRHEENSEQGIFESHMNCIDAGLAAGARNIVIFEDDVIFRRYSTDTLRACIEFVSTRPWSLLFFGCLVRRSWRTENRSVLGIRYRSLAHAYAVNRPFAERLAQKRWEGVAFDAVLRSEKGNFYSAYPGFAFQSDSPTDNMRGLRIDKWRRWCGGLCRIQKMNEFYHRHRAAILIVHGLAVVAVACLAASAFG
jgi:hypothetical protein